jgi:uncharacterized metal-binding protein YceD (DUF177 family)
LKINRKFEGLTLEGDSVKQKDGSIVITGKIKGEVEVECIKCLEKFKKNVDEDVKLKIVKPPFNGFDEEYDIIEQEKLDIEEILKGEIESQKNDYNVCKNCENEDFNKEF